MKSRKSEIIDELNGEGRPPRWILLAVAAAIVAAILYSIL